MNQPQIDTKILRIIDASLNRATEGLRTVEEYLRMILDDEHLTHRCKSLRHQLVQAVPVELRNLLTNARDSRGDVGRTIETDTEHTRAQLNDVVIANLKRTQQSLRSIEEYSKLLPQGLSRDFEKIRFETYELEKVMLGIQQSSATFPCPAVHVLVAAQDTIEQFENLVSELVSAKADFIQLRCPGATDLVVLERAKLLVKLTNGTHCRSIINNRPDIAAIVGADGVHLGQDDLPVRKTRSILRPGQLIGFSTHSLQQALDAVEDGADYIGVGPVFPSQTKAFDEFVGVELVGEVIKKTKIPAFAIGGIDTLNIDKVHAVGCYRVAVGSAITNAKDKRVAIAKLKSRTIE